MARPLSEYAIAILKALVNVIESIDDHPLTSRRARMRYYWKLINGGGPTIYDLVYNLRFRRTIHRLEARGYIQVSNSAIKLSPEAHHLAKRIDFHRHRLATPPWDGIWRVIIWDIPEAQRTLRNRARRLLKRLAVVQIQQSVWVTPHPCRDELVSLREELMIDDGLLYLEARSIEGEQALRTRFKLDELLNK